MLRLGQALALCVLALLVIGVVMVNSAGMSVDPKYAVTIESILLSRPVAYMGLAVMAMLVIGVLPVRRIAARLETERGSAPDDARVRSGLPRHMLSLWPMWLAVIGLVGIMGTVYLPGIGKQVNHSHRWVNLHLPGLESVQPSEFAKWGLVGVIAWYCCRNQRKMASFWYGLLPGLAAAGVVAAFIVVEDLGTGALVGMVATIILLAAGARLWHLALLAPIPLAGVVAAVITSPYRVHRITSFLDPYQDAQGKGYHMIQSMAAVANGRFFGTGLGHGLQKFGYLPEDTTDFLFAIICEELGVFGAALVIFLYGAMLWTCLTIIKREPSRLLRLIGLGVTATVGLQAIINLAVVTGLGPTKGIALPLLSSGGTGWILTAASLGLVIAMDRTQALIPRVRAVVPVVADAEVVEAHSPAPRVPATDERFAPPVMASTTQMVSPDNSSGDVWLAGLGAVASAAGVDSPSGPLAYAPGSDEPTNVVVTDDARDWPDSTRLRPA